MKLLRVSVIRDGPSGLKFSRKSEGVNEYSSVGFLWSVDSFRRFILCQNFQRKEGHIRIEKV